MRIKSEDMKTCFNCRLADAFIIPNACHLEIGEIGVECVKNTDSDTPIKIGGECSDWEKKG